MWESLLCAAVISPHASSPFPALTVSAAPHTKATCVGNGIDQQQVKGKSSYFVDGNKSN